MARVFFFFACRLALEGFESGSEGLTKEELKGKEVFEKLREEHQRLARVAIHTLMPAKIFQLNALLKVQFSSFPHRHTPCAFAEREVSSRDQEEALNGWWWTMVCVVFLLDGRSFARRLGSKWRQIFGQKFRKWTRRRLGTRRGNWRLAMVMASQWCTTSTFPSIRFGVSLVCVNKRHLLI